MKKLLLSFAATAAMMATPAMAADLATPVPVPYYKAPPVVAPVYNWTGFYIGGEFGGGWASNTVTIVTQSSATPGFPVGFTSTRDLSGLLGGLNAGFNYQINQFVVGIDGDYTWSGLTGSATETSPTTGDVALENGRIDWISTVTGRLGFVAGSNWLLYGKAGWAWAGWRGNTTTLNPAQTAILSTSSGSTTRDGWTAGAGIEWAFAPRWSAKVEYDYVGFDQTNYAITEVNATTGAVTFPLRSASSYLNMVKAGITYHFGGIGPLATGY
jgi:outer membrane immunogenic protein